MSAPWEIRVWGTWAAAAVVLCLSAFALIVSLSRTLAFSPVSAEVSPLAVALLAVTAISFTGVGALITTRLPHNTVGWLSMTIGLCVAVTLAGLGYVALSLPGARWAEWAARWVSLGPFVLVTYVVLLFPDGRLASPRWRPAAWLVHATAITLVGGGLIVPYGGAGQYTNPVAMGALRGVLVEELGWYLLPVSILAAVASFVARLRNASGVTRLQLKGFALAAAVAAAGVVVQNVTWRVEVATGLRMAGLGVAVQVCALMGVPVAVGAAILRYRLYDIDRVVSRTVSYVLITGTVAIVYLTVVIGVTVFLPLSSQVAVAAATLAAVAAFGPVRRRIQSAVDRRFNRQRYDAALLVEGFANELRGTVDLYRIEVRLLEVARSAVQPSAIALWDSSVTIRAGTSVDGGK